MPRVAHIIQLTGDVIREDLERYEVLLAQLAHASPRDEVETEKKLLQELICGRRKMLERLTLETVAAN